MSSYHTMPGDHTRRRAQYDLDLATSAVDELRGGAGDREVLRMAYTLGAIERVLDETDFAGDPESAHTIARIRARMQAYQKASEAR